MAKLAIICTLIGVIASSLSAPQPTKEDRKAANFLPLGTINFATRINTPHDFVSTEYFVSINAGSLEIARDDCRETFGGNGDLVSIDTEEEQKQLDKLLAAYGSGVHYWTSGVWDDVDQVWRWADDSVLPSWAPWNPAGNTHPIPPNSQYGVALNHKSDYRSTWTIQPNSLPKRYICELVRGGGGDPGEPVPCRETIDLEVALDSSGSISSVNYELAKQFVEKLATAFTAHPQSRLALRTFSAEVETVFPITNSLSAGEISTAILGARHLGQNTRTDLAIEEETKELSSNQRPNVPRKMIVLTDGASSLPAKTLEAANTAIAAGIETFAVGITPGVNKAELLAIAGGNANRVFLADNFDELIKLVTATSSELC